MIGLIFSPARDCGPKGIPTNAIVRVFGKSDVMPDSCRGLGAKEAPVASFPMRWVGTPKEVARAFAYLASNLADFINGEVRDINDGVQCELRFGAYSSSSKYSGCSLAASPMRRFARRRCCVIAASAATSSRAQIAIAMARCCLSTSGVSRCDLMA